MSLIPVGSADISLEVNGQEVEQNTVSDGETIDVTEIATHDISVNIDGASNISRSITDDIQINRTPSYNATVTLPDGNSETVTVDSNNTNFDVYETTELEHETWSEMLTSWDSSGGMISETYTIGNGIPEYWGDTIYNVSLELDGGTRIEVEGPNLYHVVTSGETETYEYDELVGGISRVYLRYYEDGSSSVDMEADVEKEVLDIE